jgi:UDP-GlcNAc:undecaprenyl-phosphate GlcNAc-1-phosphate transferase
VPRILILALAAFIITYGITPLVRKVAVRIGAVDRPNSRKVHRFLMPCLGGVAIYVGFLAVVLATQPLSRSMWGLLLGSTVILILGIVDDLRDLSPKVKLLGQIAAALLVVPFGIKVEFLTNPFDGVFQLGLFSIPVTVFWLIGVTNAINLIDGLDGLAAGVGGVAATTLAVVAWTEGQMTIVYLAVILAASTFAFLRYNFQPARIFMGDGGAMFLGFTLAALAIMGLTKSATFISLLVPVVILGIPILDTMFAIVRRYANHKPIFQADRDHLHHRLLALGLTQRQTVLIIYALSVVLSGSAVLLTQLTTAQGVVTLIILSILFIVVAEKVGVIGKKALARREFHQVRQPTTKQSSS